eukprot:TRINITY_DN8603_c0_g2_i1.p1 TRINITY_DN8603_c0_g2~~TRINITY_DN8603_c0_g2_i1.p1  ORF type:complete len:171 (+),score=28.27 TRINITY_DN8603_c0_g2_i1:52-564(+)
MLFTRTLSMQRFANGLRQMSSSAHKHNIYWPSEFSHTAQFNEIDSMRHVNNVVYFRWLENGRVDYSIKSGFYDPNRLATFVVAELNCQYLAPVFFQEKVLVRTRIPKIGKTSFTFSHEIIKENDGIVAAKGFGRCVFYDPEKQTKAIIPTEVREGILKFESPNFVEVQSN